MALYWDRFKERWLCQYYYKGRSYYVGYFKDELEARIAEAEHRQRQPIAKVEREPEMYSKAWYRKESQRQQKEFPALYAEKYKKERI